MIVITDDVIKSVYVCKWDVSCVINDEFMINDMFTTFIIFKILMVLSCYLDYINVYHELPIYVSNLWLNHGRVSQ